MSRASRRFGLAVAVALVVGALALGGLGIARLARECADTAERCDGSARCAATINRTEGALLFAGLVWTLAAAGFAAALTSRRR